MLDTDLAVAARMKVFMDGVGVVLGSDSRRASFATYAQGLLSEGERKSVEPMAARACPDPMRIDAEHQRLLHFVGVSDWDDAAVRRHATSYALSALTSLEPVQSWIVDDTGFLKQGKHSVGVQRQYTGSAGKIANCQVGVSLTLATESEHLPIDFALYLPRCWADDEDRRREARIPAAVTFKKKPDLALDMVRRALDDNVPRGVVLADAAYGTSTSFRAELQRLNLEYSLAVEGRTKVVEVGDVVTPGGAPVSLRKLATRLMAKGAFQRSAWREGTRSELSANFAIRRVVPSKEMRQNDAGPPRTLWLIIEWRDGDSAPANYFLSNLPDAIAPMDLLRITMQRWRTERAYEDLKGELGLDHFEGRRFRGWHHHISIVLCCYAFLVSERVRHFPPSPGRPLAHEADGYAA